MHPVGVAVAIRDEVVGLHSNPNYLWFARNATSYAAFGLWEIGSATLGDNGENKLIAS